MAFAAVSFNYVYLYMAEVYPTTIRNRMMAGCIAVAEVSYCSWFIRILFFLKIFIFVDLNDYLDIKIMR